MLVQITEKFRVGWIQRFKPCGAWSPDLKDSSESSLTPPPHLHMAPSFFQADPLDAHQTESATFRFCGHQSLT